MMYLTLLLLVTVHLGSTFHFGRQQSLERACRTMKAGYSQEPESVKPPFHFLVYNSDGALTNEYRLRERLTIKLIATGDQRIREFMIQGRRADPKYKDYSPIGFFTDSTHTKTICESSKNTGNVLIDREQTGETREPWKELTMYWNPPSDYLGHIEFRVTLITNYDQYWVGEASRLIRQPGLPDIATTPRPGIGTDAPLVSEIDTSQCGVTKGCYRHPKDCAEEYCALIVTWVVEDDLVKFELGADTEGWVALGFSEDKKMGDDEVIECVWNENDEIVEVRESYNHEKYNEVERNQRRVLSGIHKGIKIDRRIRCLFTRKIKLNDYYNLEEEFYFLVANGNVDDNGNKKRHVLDTHKDPLVSPHKINVRDYLDIYGRARYPLVKAHGCLMLLAWMVSTSIAIILARYYKIMWPNDRVCGRRVWFAFHRGLNVFSMIVTVIAFILIFIHAGGYSQMPDLPAKVHPILGIITTVLCILNPFIALCRCSEDHEYRPCFNWIHWLFGTVAYVLATLIVTGRICKVNVDPPEKQNKFKPVFNWLHWMFGTINYVLATPALFIGLSLPKAHVPWWATWVLLAFMLFHLLCELLLEIHGCINSRKQKQRDLEYDLMKKSDPRMELNTYRPEPVGTRFKTIIISMYLVVVIILGLVMIITVAVS